MTAAPQTASYAAGIRGKAAGRGGIEGVKGTGIKVMGLTRLMVQRWMCGGWGSLRGAVAAQQHTFLNEK